MNQNLLSSLNLKFVFLIQILLLGYIFCESPSHDDDGHYDNENARTAICNPECSYGYNCEHKNGTKECIFSTVLIVIIVIISIIGIIVIAAGIFFVCLCYCAAFNQNRLTRFFIKPKTNTEIERERIQYLEKIKKRPAYPANYFDELRRKSPAPRTFDDENNNNTGTPTSSGNEKTFKSKKQQEQKVLQPMGEKNKSLLELFPPATITTAKTTKIGTPKNGSVYCNNDKLRSNYAGSPNDKPTAAAATDLSPTDKPSISPNDKQT